MFFLYGKENLVTHEKIKNESEEKQLLNFTFFIKIDKYPKHKTRFRWQMKLEVVNEFVVRSVTGVNTQNWILWPLFAKLWNRLKNNLCSPRVGFSYLKDYGFIFILARILLFLFHEHLNLHNKRSKSLKVRLKISSLKKLRHHLK